MQERAVLARQRAGNGRGIMNRKMVWSDTDTAVLSTVADKLAVKLSDLSDQLSIPVDSLRPVLNELSRHHWVRSQPVGEEIVYRITADGVMELERKNATRGFWSRP